MNYKTGIIATSLLICAMAGPARAELSAAAADTSASPAAATGGGQDAVFSLLDKYAAESQSITSSPISETSLITALSKTGAPMQAYYSVMGSDSQQVISSVSASPPYFTFAGANRTAAEATTAGPNLAALVQWGIPVGSGAVVSGESVAPLQAVSSDPILTSTGTGPITPAAPVPVPLPFFLFGSGLTALFGFKRRGGNCTVLSA